jgi:hypothetical protein
VVVRGRWARAERLLVCRRARSGAFKKHTPWSGQIKNSDAWWVVWLRCGLDRRARLSCLLHCGTSDLCRLVRLPDHGVRERPTAAAGCHATPLAQGSACCGYKEKRCRKTGSVSLRLRTAMVRVGRRDCEAVKLLSTQFVCSTRRKHFVSNEVANCLQGRRQRFPTVRTVAELGNSEDVAKIANNSACASTGCCKRLWTPEIRMASLLKSGASRQEKASACN